jgi:anti-anti-sigma regulatory factor
MKTELQRAGSNAVVVTGGRLTFSHAGRLHKELLEAFAGTGRIDLFLHDVHEVDLTFVQLICSAHRTAVSRGAVFTVGGLEPAGPVLRLIHAAGAQRGAGCPEVCLWESDCATGSGNDAPAQKRRGKE